MANAVTRSAVTLVTEEYGRLDLPPGTDLDVTVGDDGSGARVLRISFRDTDMQKLCLHFTAYCGDHGSPLRRAKIRVADRLVTISGEAFLDLINVWQAIEIDVGVDKDAILKIDSISLGGLRYELPANALGKRIRQIEAVLARIVQQLRVESGDGVYGFVGFDLSDNRLVASFRSG